MRDNGVRRTKISLVWCVGSTHNIFIATSDEHLNVFVGFIRSITHFQMRYRIPSLNFDIESCTERFEQYDLFNLEQLFGKLDASSFLRLPANVFSIRIRSLDST